MVKIKFKSMFVAIVMLMLLINIAYATRQALLFSDVDVKVGSKSDKNVNDGETISEEAKPGDTVEFRIEVKNNYTSAENLKIENIVVKGTVESIDDGSDLDEESSEFNLNTGSTKRTTLKFQVPTEVDEDDFDVLIEAEGEDKNGTSQNIQMNLKLQVDKKTHDVVLTRHSLAPAELSCSRKNVQVGVSLLNIGTEDENDVNVHIFNTDLGVDIKENIGELQAEPFEDTSKFSKTYSFNVPNNIEAGSYPVTIRALYDDDRKKAEDTETLTISDCQAAKPQQTTGSSGQHKEEQDLSSSAAQEDKTTSVVVQQIPPETTVSTEGLFSGNGFIVAVIVAEIIAVVVGIILIVSLVARRRS